MKRSLKILSSLAAAGVLLTLIHCRTEEFERIVTTEDDVLNPGGAATSLIQRTAANDGSADNIIDQASCLRVLFPVSLLVNGQDLSINSIDDLQKIEDIFDQSALDTDTLVIIYPIQVQTVDYSEVTVGSDQELDTLRQNCVPANQPDSDIECVDFVYPVVVSIFNTSNQLIQTITFQSDQSFFEFIDDLDEDDLVTLEFPISLRLADGNLVEVNTVSELQAVIEAADDTCDEDDDLDFDDDDCEECDEETFAEVLTACEDWSIDSFERGDEDLEEEYEDAELHFLADGTFTVSLDITEFNGTWDLNLIDDTLFIELLIAGLPDFQGLWEVHDLNVADDEVRIDLRIDGDDRLRLESDCDLND